MKKISELGLVIALLIAVVVISLIAVFTVPDAANWQFNLIYGVTQVTHRIWDLHMLMFWICVVIGIGVFGVMLYSIMFHRKSRGYEASNFHENTAVEIIWTIIPFIILIAVAIPAAGTLIYVENSDNPDLTIRVTGYQWLWEYKYVDSGVHFYSRLSDSSMRARALGKVSPSNVDNYLLSVTNRVVVPKGKKVRLLLTSGDVIHAWWVPELAGKKDAIPGYINDIWFKAKKTGVYRGQCAELCGRGHAFMPIVVEVVTQKQFKDWIAKKTGSNSQSSPSAGANKQTASSKPTADKASKSGQQAKSADGKSSGQNSASSGQNSPASDRKQGSKATESAEKTDGKTGSNSSNDQKKSTQSAGKVPKSKLMSLGKQVYTKTCVACHKADGSGMSAAGFPALTGSDIVKGPVNAHIARVLNGSGAMPPFAGRLSNREVAAVVTYERNALGNSTGDVVQPSEVASQR